MTNLYDTLIGVPWFRAENYDEARARMSDAAQLPETFEEWLSRAEERERNFHRTGVTVERVYVDDDRFIEFCGNSDQPLNSGARQKFAMTKVARSTKANLADYKNPLFRHGAARKK